MRNEIELGYLGIEVIDPSALDALFADVIGLAPGDDVGDLQTWRNDDRSARLFTRSGPADDAVFVGFEATGPEAFDAVTERLTEAGFAVSEGGSEDCSSRRVERLARTTAPWGIDVEIVQGMDRAEGSVDTPLMPSGFVTEGVGFGHVVFATTAFAESVRFVVDGLGFDESDWVQTELAPGVELEVRFFHCNARHHSIALARAPFELPKRLHHVMLEARERDDVGAAFDRAWASDLAIPNGLGRHDNDGMFGFYVASPAGFHVEVGHGARTITEDWADNRRYDRISAWGHQPLRVD